MILCWKVFILDLLATPFYVILKYKNFPMYKSNLYVAFLLFVVSSCITPKIHNVLIDENELAKSQLQKQELVVFESENITQSSFDLVDGKQIIKATYLSKYDPMFWKDYSIMEPNEAIESFKVVE